MSFTHDGSHGKHQEHVPQTLNQYMPGSLTEGFNSSWLAQYCHNQTSLQLYKDRGNRGNELDDGHIDSFKMKLSIIEAASCVRFASLIHFREVFVSRKPLKKISNQVYA